METGPVTFGPVLVVFVEAFIYITPTKRRTTKIPQMIQKIILFLFIFFCYQKTKYQKVDAYGHEELLVLIFFKHLYEVYILHQFIVLSLFFGQQKTYVISMKHDSP